MPVEIYGGAGGGANLTAAQSVQTQNCVDVTLAGNSTSAGAGYILISSGTMTLAGGANVTLSQNGNAVTVIGGAGGAFSGGVSTDGNTDGTTGTVGNGLLFVGGTNITLSQSSAAGGATITINAPTTVIPPAPFEAGVSTGGNSAGDTGTVDSQVIFAGGNNITLSQATGVNGATISVVGPNAQTGISGIAGSGASTVTNGTVQFQNSNGITFGLNGSTITASHNGLTAQTGIGGIAASGASTVTNGTVQFVNSNGLTFGLNGSTITGSYSQSVLPLVSKFYWAPEGSPTSSQQVNTVASFQMVQVPYDLSFSRVDIPILVSLASSATTNTGNIEITSGLVIYSVSASNTLNPITGSFGTTTHTWASNTANWNSLTGGRLASFAISTSLSAGYYYVGFQLSTTNNSSIGASTTQYANTISMMLGSVFSGSAFGDFGSLTAAGTVNTIVGRGVQGATITGTNQTIPLGNINVGGGSAVQGNFPVLFRNY